MSLYISMLRNSHAKDWIKGTLLDGTVIGHNAGLQIHHFFPQALLRASGYPSEKINTFANYVIINKDTNLDFSDEVPVSYIRRLRINRRDLKQQCIPLNNKLWTVEKYNDFLEERRKLLAKNINLFLNS